MLWRRQRNLVNLNISYLGSESSLQHNFLSCNLDVISDSLAVWQAVARDDVPLVHGVVEGGDPTVEPAGVEDPAQVAHPAVVRLVVGQADRKQVRPDPGRHGVVPGQAAGLGDGVAEAALEQAALLRVLDEQAIAI